MKSWDCFFLGAQYTECEEPRGGSVPRRAGLCAGPGSKGQMSPPVVLSPHCHTSQVVLNVVFAESALSLLRALFRDTSYLLNHGSMSVYAFSR